MSFFIDLNQVTAIDNVIVIKDTDLIHPLSVGMGSYHSECKLLEFNEYGKPLNYYDDLMFKFDLSLDMLDVLQVYIIHMNHNHYDRLNPIVEKLREFRDNEPLEFYMDLKNITILDNDSEIVEFYLDLFFQSDLSSEAKKELINSNIIDVNICLNYIKNDYAVYEHKDFIVIFRESK